MKKLFFVSVTIIVGAALIALVETISGWVLASGTLPAQGGAGPITFVPDPDLLWRPRDLDLASLQRRPDLATALSLGDSVTMGRDVPSGQDYSSLLARCLNAHTPSKWRVLDLGVEGYSSLQVRRLFQRVGPKVRPRLVVVLVGWNDHWQDGRVPDADISPTITRLRGLAYATKTGRLLDRLAVRYARGHARWVTRVPLEDFKANLRAVARLARELEARLVFVLPVYYLPGLRADGFDEVHERYVRAIQDVAAEQHVEVLDLVSTFVDDASLFCADPDDNGVERIDYVHPNARGHAILGRGLCQLVLAQRTSD